MSLYLSSIGCSIGCYIREVCTEMYGFSATPDRAELPRNWNSPRHDARGTIIQISTVQRFSKSMQSSFVDVT